MSDDGPHKCLVTEHLLQRLYLHWLTPVSCQNDANSNCRDVALTLGCTSEDAQSAANLMQERRQAAAEGLGAELHDFLFHTENAGSSSAQESSLQHAPNPGKA